MRPGARLWWRLAAGPLALLDFVVKVSCKADVLARCDIEAGVALSDDGGIIFGAKKLGAGSVIGPRTTIGMGIADGGLPEVGRDVWIGPDCVVYGAISIGDRSTLLPGTVLTKSIPPGVVMEGNPARVVMRDFDNTALRERRDVDALDFLRALRNA